MKIRWLSLIISFVVVYLVALIGSFFTNLGVNSEWYLQNRPIITPPNIVFPIVWNILFFLIALSLYFSWIGAKDTKAKNKVALIFAINFIVNILWSAFFFGLRNPLIGFIDIILVWCSILVMILVLKKINITATWLLVPYWLWVTFAGILNLLFLL